MPSSPQALRRHQGWGTMMALTSLPNESALGLATKEPMGVSLDREFSGRGAVA